MDNPSRSSLPTPVTLEAVVFDMDGLLIDTETCDYRAWSELYQAHGEELLLADYCYSAGLYGCWDELYSALAARCGRSPEELQQAREPRFRALVEECLSPSPDLLRLLDNLQRHDIRTGVASSSDSDWVEYLLGGMGLHDRFAVVVTGHDVEQRKPAPDLYLKATRLLEVAPAGSVALEDSAHGIQAAQAAGLRVIAVPNSVSRHQDLSAADTEVAGLHAITLDLLRRLLR
jgi:HAD superfamily hydrolase (TIGR01509 family)